MVDILIRCFHHSWILNYTAVQIMHRAILNEIINKKTNCSLMASKVNRLHKHWEGNEK